MPPVSLSTLAAELGCPWDGPTDPPITGAAGLDDAGAGDITFVGDRRLLPRLQQTQAAAVVLAPGVESPLPALRADEPYRLFARILARFAPPRERLFPPGVHATAVLGEGVRLGEGVSIGPWCVVGAGASIGDGTALGAGVVVGPDAAIGRDCTLHPLACVREGCRLGDRVILQSGAVIGSDGFGYLPGREGMTRIPQIGIVVLEDDVEVGANACVDRATTGRTVVGRGTKIDNLVQVAHNVRIGRHCALSAQTGVSGSCRVGDGVIMAGQVGVADHRQVGDGARLAAKSGIDRDVEAGQTVFGYPALEMKRAYRLVAHFHRLPELAERLRRVERELGLAGTGEEE